MKNSDTLKENHLFGIQNTEYNMPHKPQCRLNLLDIISSKEIIKHEEKYIHNDVKMLAFLIDEHMKEFIKDNPNNKSQEDCENYVLGIMMRKTKGHINPSLMLAIIKIHRLPMEEAGFIMQC